MEDPNKDDTPNGWLLIPATNLVEFIANETAICATSQRLMNAIQLMPSLITLAGPHLLLTNPELMDSIKGVIKGSHSAASFARQEIDSGFQTIFSHHAVAIWAGVETAIERTLLNLIRKVANAHDVILASCPNLNSEKFKTKTANDAERALKIWEGELKNNSFEKGLFMLKSFSLDVQISAHSRKALIEMSEVRNVLLHNGGFVDERFLAKCPWLPAKAGEHLVIKPSKMSAYIDASHDFATAIIGAVVKSPHIYTKPEGD